MRKGMIKLQGILLFLTFTIGLSAQENGGYHLNFKVDGVKNDTVYLAYYFGKKLFYQDTAYADSKGNFEFKGKEDLKGGMYAVILSKRNYFDLIIDEPEFKIKTSKNAPTRDVKVRGSKENKAFFDYINFVRSQKQRAGQLKQKLKRTKGQEKKEKIKEELSGLDKKVRDYQKKMVEKNPDLLTSKIISASMQVDVPNAPDSLDKDESQKFRYHYYKDHYFDHIDLKDERLARTPIFANKLNKYIKKTTVQHPDSIINSADRILEEVEPGSEMYKYVVSTITNEYINSKVMGMDEVFVHMAENYYFGGKADWMKEKQLKEWKDRVNKIKPLLIGKKAPSLILADTSGKFIDLYNVDADYTVLYFWDPECGHCKKATPRLLKAYQDSLKEMGVEIYAIGTPLKTKKWKQYIQKNGLNWINVSDNPDINNNPRKYLDRTDLQSMNFRDTYDIYSTPRIFLLDEDKTIIAKGLGVDQLTEHISDLVRDKAHAGGKPKKMRINN